MNTDMLQEKLTGEEVDQLVEKNNEPIKKQQPEAAVEKPATKKQKKSEEAEQLVEKNNEPVKKSTTTKDIKVRFRNKRKPLESSTVKDIDRKYWGK